ncbi:MAG: 23S rRNA (uracil(1939)-C(5))-methyltransferase RlmD, partial [Anaeroplasmataceae bacterium]
MLDKLLEVEVIDIDYLGKGIAKIPNYTIFIDNAIPLDKVLVKVYKVYNSILFASTVDIITPSKYRVTPICNSYDKCGGCSIQHMSYDYQLEFKTNSVKNTIFKMYKEDYILNNCIANPNLYNYRNKVIVPTRLINNKLETGFYEEGSHNLIPTSNCYLENKQVKDILDLLKDIINKSNISIYDESTDKGIVKNIMLRCNKYNEFMIVIVLKEHSKVLEEALKPLESIDYIKSIYFNINSKKTNVVLSYEFKHILKEKYIIEDILNLKFYVHPNSFLQVNNKACEILYSKALEYASIKSSDVVLDAFCGIGTISLLAAQKAKKVYGIEVVQQAIDNANENKLL